ncbi:hypothetical protein BDR05DRAFT_896013 [Suillus weaverae]|nr:hypothetical protein BDR05DRAFT_896013 [Suillus weaverae]
MVGAFRDWHPMYIDGTGHTEGEGCEHVFSASNELARSTRHASVFHRHQTIEEHFAFWDADKYAALSNFLRNHYREALTSIHTLTAELLALTDNLGLTDADFIKFHSEERLYLDSLKTPPPKELLQIHNVEVLDELAERQSEWNLAREAGNQALTTIPIGDLNQISAALSQARIRVDSAYGKLQNAEALTAHVEMQLQVEEWWAIGDDMYNKYKQETSLRQYCIALDELECLVVMRLFELSKLSLSGTGMDVIYFYLFLILILARLQTMSANWQGLATTL